MMKNNTLLLSIFLLVTANIFAQDFIASADFKRSKTKGISSSFFLGKNQINLHAPHDLSTRKMYADLGPPSSSGKEMRKSGTTMAIIGGGIGAIGAILVVTDISYYPSRKRKTGMALATIGGLIGISGLVIRRVGAKKIKEAIGPLSLRTSGSDLGLWYTF